MVKEGETMSDRHWKKELDRVDKLYLAAEKENAQLKEQLKAKDEEIWELQGTIGAAERLAGKDAANIGTLEEKIKTLEGQVEEDE